MIMNLRSSRTMLIAFCLAACSFGARLPTPTPIRATPTPQASATPIRTPTPLQTSLHVTEDLVNCRFGPSLLYVLIDELSKGDRARVLGRNDSSTWLYVRDPGNPDGTCWIAANVAVIDGDLDALPVVQSPATSVTSLDLLVDPTIISVQCSQFPQTFFFKAEMTANGPLLVTWRWEASTGAVSDIRTLVFDGAGTKVINDYYQVGGPNDYWVKLHVLSPNVMSRQANFIATC